MNDDQDNNPETPVRSDQESSNAASSGPLEILFPPHEKVWREARRLVGDKSIRVEDLAVCAMQDPVIVLELLKSSNAIFFAGGGSTITSVKTAITRLGSEVVLETLDKLENRRHFDNEEVSHWFEVFRSKGRRTAIVARVLSEALAKHLADDCQATGLLTCVGDMLAVAFFGQEYVTLADEHSRSGTVYQLATKHRFDVESMGLKYLRKYGIPEALVFAIDREARTRQPERAILRPLCMAASEMVDAFDANRWEKLAPGRTLPPKSSVRVLKLNDSQYLKIYERVAEYLFAARLAEEREMQAEVKRALETSKSDLSDDLDESHESNDLASEIENLIGRQSAAAEQPEAERQPTIIPPPKAGAAKTRSKATVITEVKADLKTNIDQFSLQTSRDRSAPRAEAPTKIIAPPTLRTKGGNAVVSSITTMFDKAASSEDLLTELLGMLVDRGPFKQSALIVVSKDRKNAIVVASRGTKFGNGQKLALDDPLSPLARCFSKVQSYGNRENASSPFGSKAFALAPIDADHDTPVALYADCGHDGSLPFEARRVFRTVVDILNQKLPTIPGGIPVELDS